MPSKIIINPRAEINRPMNVCGFYQENCKMGLRSHGLKLIQAGSGDGLAGDKPNSPYATVANPDGVVDYL